MKELIGDIHNPVDPADESSSEEESADETETEGDTPIGSPRPGAGAGAGAGVMGKRADSTASLSNVDITQLQSGVDLSALAESKHIVESVGGDDATIQKEAQDVGEDTDAQEVSASESDSDSDDSDSSESSGGFTFGATTAITDEVSLDSGSVRTKKTKQTFRSHRSRADHMKSSNRLAAAGAGAGLFGGSQWFDLAMVRHNVLDGDVSAVEEMRAKIEEENEAEELMNAEKDFYWSTEYAVFNKVLAKRKAKKLAKFQRMRDAAIEEVRSKVEDTFVRQLDGLKENHQSNLELWNELEYQAHNRFLEFNQGWKQDASEAVMEMIGPLADTRAFRKGGVLKDETALYDLVSSDDLKRREHETLQQAKRRKKAEAKLRKLVTIDDARRVVWRKCVGGCADGVLAVV